MNTFEKVMKFCYENKIPAEIGHIYKGKGLSLQIWTASNSYFWARIHEKEDSRYSDVLPRTVITDEVFDIEMYKPNGDAYQGSFSRRISYKTLIEQLKIHFLEEY